MMASKTFKRGGAPKTLGHQAGKITRPIFGARGLSDGAIVNDWANIVGELLARHSAPQRVVCRQGRKDGGVLHLRIDSGGLAMEIQHLTPVLIERINGYFGFRAIDALKIIQGPLPERPDDSDAPAYGLNEDENRRLMDDLQGVDDPELQDALAALGRAVRGRDGDPDGKKD